MSISVKPKFYFLTFLNKVEKKKKKENEVSREEQIMVPTIDVYYNQLILWSM